MAHFLPLLVLLFAAACALAPVLLAARLRRCTSHASQTAAPLPRVLVILPCKGVAEELPYLEQNLQPVLEQDYPHYRVVFAIGDPDDLAAPVLRRLCEQSPRASLVVAPPRSGCSRKIANQLAALDHMTDRDDVLVFLDSDARPEVNLLRHLVAPLANGRCAAATGFRWYTPGADSSWASWLRAAWNAGGLAILADERYRYVWGGAMAVRRDAFEDCRAAQYWARALSDDLGLTALLRQRSHAIAFVPQCLIRSPEDMTLAQTLEWTNRQTLICRVYHGRMWRDLLVGECITALVFLAGAMLTVTSLISSDIIGSVSGLVSLTLPLLARVWYQWQAVRFVARHAPQLTSPGSTWRLVLLAPLVHPLILCNSLHSSLRRTLTWRGIRYRLDGPWRLTVLNP